VILGVLILIASLQMKKKVNIDNRIRVDRGAAVKLSAIRRFFSLSGLSEAANQSITVYSDDLARQNPKYAEMLAEEAIGAESGLGDGDDD
jgi:predicted nucleic acid-binding OB-fold protein